MTASKLAEQIRDILYEYYENNVSEAETLRLIRKVLEDNGIECL